jgi:putative glutamine amidotransferase
MAVKTNVILNAIVSDNDADTVRMVKRMGFNVIDESSVDKTFPDIVFFTGGSDIHPFIYGQKRHAKTFPNPTRDLKEISLWKSLSPETPKVGICRGAQLGNVLCGGSLYQDVDCHRGSRHGIRFFDDDFKLGEEMSVVNSDHHQMCVINDNAKLLAVANISTYHETDEKRFKSGDWRDVEAFYYLHENFLGVQWHPEWEDGPSFDLFEELFYRHLFN